MKSLFFYPFLFCFVLFFQSLFATNPSGLQYSVYVRPDGDLGTDLDRYWEAVLDSDLSHQAIKQYPPHCTVTAFFFPSHDANYYLEKIQEAITLTDNQLYPRTITVNSSIQHGHQVDRLVLNSAYIKAFGNNFVSLVGLPASFVKGPPAAAFHITLRDHVFVTPGKLPRIRELQNDNVDPTDSAGWLIYLYKKENDVVTAVGQPIRLIPAP